MKPTEYAQHDAVGLAELVRTRQVTPLELVDAAIALSEKHAALNAVVTRTFEQARHAAQERPSGVLAGVPFLLKDGVISVNGVRSTHGARAYAERVASFGSAVVTRFRKAGLIVLGLTNAPELAMGVTTEGLLHGPCRNPWNPGLTPGGTSGGSAASVAAGVVPAAHGTDSGGSLRAPASCCGLFTLKPSRGRVPVGPVESEVWQGLSTDGVLTRSVRDSAVLLDALAGAEPGDLFSLQRPTRAYAQEVAVPPGRLRVACSPQSLVRMGIHPECRAAVQLAANLAGQLGHEVTEDAPQVDWAEFGRGYALAMGSFIAADLRDAERALGRKPGPADFEPRTFGFAALGERTTAGELEHAWRTLRRLSRALGPFFARYDLFITPTLGVPPLPLGKLAPQTTDTGEMMALHRAFSPFAPVWNVTGQPAMSVPLHWMPDGLPVGVQFVTRFGAEGLLFRVAAQLEQAQPWAHRHPPDYG